MKEEKNGTISKLSIDNEKDFKFHMAYLAYSSTWDENDNNEVRKKLNDLIASLSESKTDYDYNSFYNDLKHHRTDIYRAQRRGGAIQTQRKREWRVKETKRTRNIRHRRR